MFRPMNNLIKMLTGDFFFDFFFLKTYLFSLFSIPDSFEAIFNGNIDGNTVRSDGYTLLEGLLKRMRKFYWFCFFVEYLAALTYNPILPLSIPIDSNTSVDQTVTSSNSAADTTHSKTFWSDSATNPDSFQSSSSSYSNVVWSSTDTAQFSSVSSAQLVSDSNLVSTTALVIIIVGGVLLCIVIVVVIVLIKRRGL